MILSVVVVVQILINALVYIPVADPEGALRTLMMLFAWKSHRWETRSGADPSRTYFDTACSGALFIEQRLG